LGVNALDGLDVLVNNAGISGPTSPVEDFDPDAWDKVVQINLNGTFNVTRLAIPHLKKSPAGVIIIMSSVAGRFGYPNRSAYSATKWGLIGFTKTLSRELGPHMMMRSVREAAPLRRLVRVEHHDQVHRTGAAQRETRRDRWRRFRRIELCP
jgi:NAD(P)-dependent dehydrogenase (short-subunit alcohol dehydrogenase family)